MGLGLNAAYRKDFQDYQLQKLPIAPGQTGLPIDFVPNDLPASKVEEFKGEFATWVTGCGLRELLEHYAVFLDALHHNALFVLQAKGENSRVGDPVKLQREFTDRLGIADKLKALKKRFGIEPADSEAIGALYVARNCLTHDLGNVSPKRMNEGDAFVLRWRAINFLARGAESGAEQFLVHLIGNVTTEQTDVAMMWVERSRSFKSGDKLILSQQDLWEVCFFFNAVAIPSAIKSFVRFLKAHDIPENPAT
jgi:hypothetical protein